MQLAGTEQAIRVVLEPMEQEQKQELQEKIQRLQGSLSYLSNLANLLVLCRSRIPETEWSELQPIVSTWTREIQAHKTEGFLGQRVTNQMSSIQDYVNQTQLDQRRAQQEKAQAAALRRAQYYEQETLKERIRNLNPHRESELPPPTQTEGQESHMGDKTTTEIPFKNFQSPCTRTTIGDILAASKYVYALPLEIQLFPKNECCKDTLITLITPLAL
jgi:hypothetical protein